MKRPPDEAVNPSVWCQRHLTGAFTLYQTHLGFQRLVFDDFPQPPWAPYQGFKDRMASASFDSHWGGERGEVFTFRSVYRQVWAHLCRIAPRLPTPPFPLDQALYLEREPDGERLHAKDADGIVLLTLTAAGGAAAVSLGMPLLLDAAYTREMCFEVGGLRQQGLP